MSNNNWIKLNRSIWDCFVWDFDNPKLLICWIDILLLANYRDKNILMGGKYVLVKRGSFITSMVKLSERWKMHRKTVKKYLDVLQEDGMIKYETNNKYTMIYVVKYIFYQGFLNIKETNQQCCDSDSDLDDSLDGLL